MLHQSGNRPLVCIGHQRLLQITFPVVRKTAKSKLPSPLRGHGLMRQNVDVCVSMVPTEERGEDFNSLCRNNDALQGEGIVQKALCRKRSDKDQANEEVCQVPPSSERLGVVDGGGLLDLPNDLLRVIAEGLLGSDEGRAEVVVRAWLRLRLTCRNLCKLIADVPLDLRFSAPLTSAQVAWMMDSEVKLRSVVFALRPTTALWLEVACVSRRPSAICRSRDTLEKLQGLVLGRQDFRHCDLSPLLGEMARELGPVASYDFQGFSKLTSLTLYVDDTAAFTLPPSLEDLHLGYLTRHAWWVERPTSAGMGHVSVPRLRRLQVELTPWAGTEWLPLLVPSSLEFVQLRSDCQCLVDRRIHACWGQDWPKAANIKSLVLRDVLCPFDAAVLHVEELRLEQYVACFSSARSPEEVLWLFMSGRCRRLLLLPNPPRGTVQDALFKGILWYGENGKKGPSIKMRQVVSVAESPEYQPYLEVHAWAHSEAVPETTVTHYAILRREFAQHSALSLA
eukprot:jgi/Botrbrau1/20356/Bobra.0006s0022.2